MVVLRGGSGAESVAAALGLELLRGEVVSESPREVSCIERLAGSGVAVRGRVAWFGWRGVALGGVREGGEGL